MQKIHIGDRFISIILRTPMALVDISARNWQSFLFGLGTIKTLNWTVSGNMSMLSCPPLSLGIACTLCWTQCHQSAMRAPEVGLCGAPHIAMHCVAHNKVCLWYVDWTLFVAARGRCFLPSFQLLELDGVFCVKLKSKGFWMKRRMKQSTYKHHI